MASASSTLIQILNPITRVENEVKFNLKFTGKTLEVAKFLNFLTYPFNAIKKITLAERTPVATFACESRRDRRFVSHVTIITFLLFHSVLLSSNEKMSLNSFQPTPCIVVEDVDHVQTRLEFQSPPSHHLKIHDNNNDPSPLSLCTTFGIIKPDIDAYVSPLSLCQQPMTPKSPSVPVCLPFKDKVMVVSRGTMPPCLATSGLESSFTSVDIGGPGQPAARSADNDSSWNSEFSQQTTGCFDLKSGLMCVTRAITSSADPLREKCDHHRIDISESPLELNAVKSGRRSGQPSKKQMSLCSMVGIFLICLVVIGLMAIGISMYIEFVSKPSRIAESKQPILNETTICDYLLNSCDNNTLIINSTAEPMRSNQTNIAMESGRVEATFSRNFTSQLATKLPGNAA